MVDREAVKEVIVEELPEIVQRDRRAQLSILRLTKPAYADKAETESRFDQMLAELQRAREADSRKWEEQKQKWDEEQRKWDEQKRNWDEHQRQLDEQNQRWHEQNQKWDEQNQKWWENQQAIHRTLDEIKALNRKHDQTIGALGARWGLHAEEAFRSGLRAILEDYFGVQVLRFLEFDREGEVFGRPDQIELDLIVKNGLLIIAEIKSSISREEMYAFSRKVDFYSRHHDRTADRVMVVAPMVQAGAGELAQNLGIEVYTYVEGIDPATMGGYRQGG